MSGLVDFHCHLDLFPDLEAAVRTAEDAGVYTLTVTTTPKAWPRNREVTVGARFVRAALGLHPQLVAERSGEFALWERYLADARYVGEVGLDAGPRFYRSFDLQKQIFTRILRSCSEAGGKILTVHSVRAAKHVLDAIEANLSGDRGRVVLHWFTGSVAEARRAVALGCYFSINAEMTRSERGKVLVASLPIDRLLTETDGPFTHQGDRPAHPSDTAHTVEAISVLRDLTPTQMAAAIRRNLRSLTAFGSPVDADPHGAGSHSPPADKWG